MASGRPCFIGAQGYGSTTPGGRGGPVLRVTTLADDNPAPPGSYREAVRTAGPRHIVFDVEGRIELVRPIKFVDPFCTVHGQTAPGEGIVLSGEETRIQSHDIVIRHLRMRTGDDHVPVDGWDNADGCNTGTPDDVGGVYNVVVDHCSIAWGTDETLTAWYKTHDVTFSHCIIAEGLFFGNHPKTLGPPFQGHSMGHLFGDVGPYPPHDPLATFSHKISSHHNLLVSCNERMPQLSLCDEIDFRGNVIYNWGEAPLELEKPGGPDPLGVKRVNVYRNAWLPGPNRGTHPTCIAVRDDASDTRLYIAENFGPIGRTMIRDPRFNNWNFVRLFGGTQLPEEVGPTRFRLDVPFDCPRVCVAPTEQNIPYVIANAGAMRKGPEGTERRDATDRRIVQTVLDDNGAIINSPHDVGGYLT